MKHATSRRGFVMARFVDPHSLPFLIVVLCSAGLGFGISITVIPMIPRTCAPSDATGNTGVAITSVLDDLLGRAPLYAGKALVPGGTCIMRSPLLARRLPGYCFLRITTCDVNRWWLLNGVRSVYAAPRVIVVAIPGDGGQVIECRDPDGVGRLFRAAGVTIQRQTEAEELRLLLLELLPETRRLSSTHLRSANTEWKIAINEKDSGQSYFKLTTDSAGRFQHGRFVNER